MMRSFHIELQKINNNIWWTKMLIFLYAANALDNNNFTCLICCSVIPYFFIKSLSVMIELFCCGIAFG